jgi:hypothetical protein
MAAQAKTHIVADGLLQVGRITNVSMALFTGNASSDMRLVAIVDKIRLVEGFHPA